MQGLYSGGFIMYLYLIGMDEKTESRTIPKRDS